MNGDNEIAWLIMSIVNAVMSVLFLSCLVLFFTARKKIISYMQINFTSDELNSFGIAPNSASRYIKWGKVFSTAKEIDPILAQKLECFRLYQLGVGDSFAVWIVLQILLVWFFYN